MIMKFLSVKGGGEMIYRNLIMFKFSYLNCSSDGPKIFIPPEKRKKILIQICATMSEKEAT